MTQQRNGPPQSKAPAPSGTGAYHDRHVDNTQSTCCSTKGCPWRGRCPVHGIRYIAGFHKLGKMLRARPGGGGRRGR